MSKIYYEQFAGRYIISECKEDGGDKITLLLDTPIDGKIIINGSVVVSTTEGAAVIDRRRLKDGKCYPTLYLSDRYVRLEPFMLTASGASPYEGEEYIRSIYNRLILLEKKEKELSQRVTLLEEKLLSDKIF